MKFAYLLHGERPDGTRFVICACAHLVTAHGLGKDMVYKDESIVDYYVDIIRFVG
jgi:hypothetical protein